MSDAPERIWIYAWGGNWSPVSGGTQEIEYIRPARKGKGSVEDGISFLQGLDLVVHPRCANLIREFGSYAYMIDKRTGEILPEPEDANNHLIEALTAEREWFEEEWVSAVDKLNKAVEALRWQADQPEAHPFMAIAARTTLAEIEGEER
jgi:hypothetical protein